MNIELLKTFVSVARHGSVSKAGKEVNLTQPAITKQIQILEQEYGIKLFERERHKLFLTSTGQALLTYAYRMLELYNESHVVVTRQRLRGKATLKIGANRTLGIYLLPRLMKGFLDANPGLSLDMIIAYIENTDNVLEAVKRGEVILGFVGEIPGDASVAVHPFYRDRLKIVVGPDWDKGKGVTWKELESMPFISREQGSDIRAACEEWFRSRQSRLVPRMEMNSTEAIKLSIHYGLGFSILPWCTVEEEVRVGFLRTLSVPRLDVFQQFFICYFEGRKFFGPEVTFLEYILDRVKSDDLRAR